jgi:hypothetical protein
MSCAPIDTNGSRFTVLTVTGYPISVGGATAKNAKPGLSATVLDRYYGSEHGTFASWDVWQRFVPWKPEGEWVTPLPYDCRSRRRSIEGALAAAADRCAELNAWHEREGWDE